MVGRCHAANPVTKPGRSLREWNIGGAAPGLCERARAVTPFRSLSYPFWRLPSRREPNTIRRMSKKTRHRRAKLTARHQNQSALNLLTHPDAAGIDVGAEEFVVAVPPGHGGQENVRTFKSFTSGVEALRDWLQVCGIKTAAMEPS